MKSLLSAIVFFGLVQNLYAGSYSADLFEQGSKREKKLFTLDVSLTDDGAQSSYKATFKDLNGSPVVEQTAILRGAELVRDEIQQRQTGLKGLIEVKEGRVYFTKTVNGKDETSDEKLGKNLVSSANFQRYIGTQMEALKKGETVDMRYAVWSRKETVGFSIKKIGEEGEGDQKIVQLKMSPTSFIIRQLVDPVLFKFNHDGSKLLEMNGRVQPLRKDGEKFKDLDAEVLYKY